MDWIQLEGESMRPVLAPEDWIGVQWLAPEETRQLQIGEIVLVRSPTDPTRSWVAHRIVARQGNEFTIKGDFAFAFDSESTSQIWGRITEVRLSHLPERTRKFRRIAADRLIAYLSTLTVPADTLQSRVARKLLYGCGLIRRASL